MDIFDFEELMAEMLGVTDEQREEDDYLPDRFAEKYSMEFEDGFSFARDLLEHTVPLEAGLSKKTLSRIREQESTVYVDEDRSCKG